MTSVLKIGTALVLGALAVELVLATVGRLAAGSARWSVPAPDGLLALGLVILPVVVLAGLLALRLVAGIEATASLEASVVRWSLGCAGAALVSGVLGLRQALAGWGELLAADNLVRVVSHSQTLTGRATMIGIAGLVALVARYGSSRVETAGTLALVLAGASLLVPTAPPTAGHGVLPPGVLDVGLALVQLVAVVGLGGLLAALVRHGRELAPPAVERALRATAAAALVLAGAVLGSRLAALPAASAVWSSSRGQLLVLEAPLVGVLGVVLVRFLDRVGLDGDHGRPVPLLIVVGGTAVLAAAVVLTSALAPVALAAT